MKTTRSHTPCSLHRGYHLPWRFPDMVAQVGTSSTFSVRSPKGGHVLGSSTLSNLAPCIAGPADPGAPRWWGWDLSGCAEQLSPPVVQVLGELQGCQEPRRAPEKKTLPPPTHSTMTPPVTQGMQTARVRIADWVACRFPASPFPRP